MDTTTSTVIAVLIVAVGQWTKKDGTISIKLVVGLMVLVLMLSALSSVNDDLAKKFALLVLVTVVFTYFIPIAQKLGLVK